MEPVSGREALRTKDVHQAKEKQAFWRRIKDQGEHETVLNDGTSVGLAEAAGKAG